MYVCVHLNEVLNPQQVYEGGIVGLRYIPYRCRTQALTYLLPSNSYCVHSVGIETNHIVCAVYSVLASFE